MEKKEKIGFIGLGLMGRQITRNLLRRGFPVTVYNRSLGPVEEAVKQGASAASSPKELAKHSDIVIAMVTDAPDVEQVILGADGVFHELRSRSLVVDMSTNSPQFAQHLAKELAQKHVEVLDAPVTGGQKGAIEGTLTIMVGGSDAAFQRCLPVFQAVGSVIVHMGAVGSGQIAKLCNQAIVALDMLAASEAFLLGSKAGLDLKKLRQVLNSGAASSWTLENLVPRMLKRDFEPGFRAAHLLKDLRYLIDTAEQLQVPMLGSALAYQLYNTIVAHGLGDKGTQVLVTALEEMANHRIEPT